VDGVVYANVWQDTHIARIDSRTGEVTGWLDASGLLAPEEARDADVLNGIAYLPASGHLALTGKLWPRIFEVEIVLDAPPAAK
jgi:glutamine cyclotransferase